MINNWAEADEVLPHFEEIKQSILDICSDLSSRQKPLVIQPVWKTDGKKMRLKDDCMDVFVWSNLAVIQMCIIPGNRSYRFLKSEEQRHPRIQKKEIKNIILGGGQNLLSPERRFDAVLVNSPDLFEE